MSDEFEPLKEFRANLPGPDDDDVAAARSALQQEIAHERTTGFARPTGSVGSVRRRWALAGAGVAAALAIGLGVAFLVPSGGSGPAQPAGRSLATVALGLQSGTALDFEHLPQAGLTLDDIASMSDVVGIGDITDVRLAYKEPDGAQHMFLVIKPEQLDAGGDRLGVSGDVLVDELAPPTTSDGSLLGFQQLRDAAISSHEKVAFMLTPAPASWSSNSPDPYAGRAKDDPIFVPTHPSALLAVNTNSDEAFPLETDENLKESTGNLEAMDALGADVNTFTVEGEELNAGAP